MGLTPLLSEYLDQLEEAGPKSVDLQSCVNTVKDICLGALQEAKTVYSKLAE